MASIALIAACGSNDSDDGTTAVPEDGGSGGSSEPAVSIVSSRWVLSQLETADASLQPSGESEAWFEIGENGDVTGSTGCNGFSGAAEVSDSSITFQPLISTRRGCSGELGDIDNAMLGVLRGEVTAEVSGDVLTITNAEGGTLTLQASDQPATEL
ncbi:META domain-containing protein [Jiangella asiatica]|uniref:META domain-containing protein n=1 Tax=Jiangella asiatica TaxID=2530372 RepID=UPI0013A5D004|nr:META domain-containing protein [Jiangella asiatica]